MPPPNLKETHMLVSVIVGVVFVIGGAFCHSQTLSMFGIGLLCAYALVADIVSLLISVAVRKS